MAEERLAEACRLRAEGWTWADIGGRFGITRQGASQLVKRAEKARKTGL